MKKIVIIITMLMLTLSFALLSCKDTLNDNSNTNKNTETNETANEDTTDTDKTHVHSYGKFVLTQSPTCSQWGLRTRTCSCGKELTQKVQPTGHTEEVIQGKAPTCTETGLTEGKKCSECGAIIVKQTTINVTGHTEEVIPGRAPTCTETGLTEGKKCSECGAITVKQTTINVTGHTEEAIPGRAPTCTETGLTEGKKCSVCDEIIEKQAEMPIAHSYENGACSKCGSLKPSEGLKINKYETYCSVVGMGSCTDTVVVLPSIYEGLPVTKFSGFSENLTIEEIVLPDTITEIHAYAFEDCINLKRVSLGKEVVKINSSAFSGCINLISVENTNAVLDVGDFAFFQTSITEINIEGAIKIGKSSFSQCKKLETVHLGENLTVIGDSAFSSCESLKNIKLNSKLMKIGDSAFSGCSSLKSIIIPISVTEIDNYAFGNCDNLTIYCEAESKPSGWGSYWNSNWFLDKTTVVWNYAENN